VSASNKLETAPHFERLRRAYAEVGSQTWVGSEFHESKLSGSRALFEPESLISRDPRPKQLEVIALVSGIPFDPGFIAPILDVQRAISEILGGSLHYWVNSQNLGVEYCVFKWPEDQLNLDGLPNIKKAIEETRLRTFEFTIGGIQINPDGCVVARGFDDGAAIFRVRDSLKRKMPSLPTRQSEWAHVPLGRILEPLNSGQFQKLRSFAADMAERKVASTRVVSMKLVHEKRWYMEEKSVLAEYLLDSMV
jgi:hypothetical protein